jgi:peroxiredoxin
VLLLAFTSRCSTQSSAVVSGKITPAPDWKPVVYLVQPRNFGEIAASFMGTVVDSAAVKPDGSFLFPAIMVNLEQPLFQLCLVHVGAKYANQLYDDNPLNANYMPLVLQPGDRLEIQADAARFQATFALKSPSAENKALLNLRDIRHQSYAQQQQVLQSTVEHEDGAGLMEQEDAMRRFQAPLIAFADSVALLFSALVATRWVSTTADYERIPEFIAGQCKKWQSAAQNTWVSSLCQAGDKNRLPVLLGDTIPNYPLPMLAGDTVMLQQLLGKRLTILDIWASWCMPCRRENREVLAPIWAQYRSKGLQILGYSIDSSPAAWKAAVAKDGAIWPHASHLSGDATPFLETLKISTIPANFILDDKGVIIAKNLHGDALRVFLEHYFR